MKSFYQLVLVLTIPIIGYTQTSTVQYLNGNQYLDIGHEWHLYDSGSQQLYKIISDKVSIKFNDGVSQSAIQTFINSHNLQLLSVTFNTWYDFIIPSGSQYFTLVNQLKQNSIDDKLEVPVFAKPSATPNDPDYSLQVYLNQASDIDIDAAEAWDIATGDPSVVIAIIDSGTDWEHVDLGPGTDGYQNIWLNDLEDDWSDPNDPTSGDGIDNDNNGYIDDWKGYDFYSTNQVRDNDARPAINDFHGSHVAGLAAAKTNNNRGVSGVAGGWNSPGARIMCLRVGDDSKFGTVDIDNAIEYAAMNGAKIINLSFKSPNIGPISFAINRAIEDYNCIIFASAGNTGLSTVEHPAAYPNVIAVGATSANDDRINFSNYGDNTSISAPGYYIRSLYPNNGYGNQAGTSSSCPVASGVAALLLSVNPCIEWEEMENILQQTAEKVGGHNYNWNVDKPGHSRELGYGRINAKDAVTLAQTMYSAQYDLYMKDTEQDFGQSPSPGLYTDAGPDIWYRNNDDGLTNQESEDLVWDGSKFWVYVRVRNKGCSESSGGTLDLHWSRAGSAFSWPTNWVGATSNGDGDLIASKPLPNIPAGQDVILKFEWDMQSVLQNSPNNHAEACLLARIEGLAADPIGPTTTLYNDVKKENNLTMKNVIIRDAVFFKQEGRVTAIVGGTDYESGIYDILFRAPEGYTGNPLYKEAEITVILDQQAWDKWSSNEFRGENVKIISQEDRKILIQGDNATISGLDYQSKERSSIEIAVNFLVDEVSDKNKFLYHMVQTFHDDPDKIVGGVHFYISKDSRTPFDADAGSDQYLKANQATYLSANTISEPATYNWYDSEGSLIYSGTDTTITQSITEKYKLEVISLLDGFKDYDEVDVIVSDYYISSFLPNPATDNINVDYHISNSGSAYIMMIDINNTNNTSNFILDVSQNQANLNVQNLSRGIYAMLLVVDGQIVDSQITQLN